MKKGKKILLIIGVILSIIAIMAVFGAVNLWSQSTPVKKEVLNESANGTKIIILTDYSEYKIDVKDLILNKVDSDCCVEVFGLSDINNVNCDDYDLVVIMAPVYAGRLQTDARKFISKNKTETNLLLFMSAGLIENLNTGVDTIVSATVDFDTAKTPQLTVDEVANKIIDKLG